MMQEATPEVREAVGVFDDSATLQRAIDELLSSGFDRAELSLLASEHAVDEKLGHHYARVEELEDEPGVLRTFYVAPESVAEGEGALIGGLVYVGATAAMGAAVASGGPLAATLAALAVGGGVGGAIGGILAGWLGRQYAHHIEEQLDHGGLLLWVRTWNEQDEKSAVEILSRNSGRDVHVHALPA